MPAPARGPLRVHALIDSLTWGGAERLLADFAAGAPSAGIELSVGYLQDVDDSPSAQAIRDQGVEPLLVGVRRLLDLESVRRVRRQLAELRPDVVHTHLGAADALGAVAARTLGIPVVSTIHLMGGPPPGAGARMVARERLMAFARRRGAVRVIAVSDAAREAYLATGWDRPQHVVTVHNGIAPAAPRADPAAVRAGLGLDPDDLVVTVISVLRPGKGHDVAADAVRRLLPRHPRLRLLVVGTGPALAQIRELTAPLGEAAQMTGHRDDVTELLGVSDVLLHPTSMDAFPTVLLEAGAAGVPVIATAVGGVPEIVVDGETGVLVPFPPTGASVARALEPLLSDGALRARLGTAARARFAATFTAERWAGRLREVYELALGGQASQRR
ncbi:MAG: glycosyl transferase group 1 [Conexibacter sp.]|jgi:glycosyltransferase involved in cell wall biosynthesis|nr:glycosyl transferase group 1 [Conexibacter sp.]